jgi:serine/threonine protein kinase
MIKELEVLTKMHHPHVVQFFGYITEPFIIVMEYLSGGELLDYVKNKITMKNKNKIKICLDILKALAYLHNREPEYVIHRDIKPQNILICKTGRVKIADFGISRSFRKKMQRKMSQDFLLNEENEERDLTNFVGSVRYMAPEVKNNKDYDNTIDIWSAGIIFAELFENQRYNSEFYWNKTPKPIQSLILNYMIQEEPTKRYNAKKIILMLEEILLQKKCGCFF